MIASSSSREQQGGQIHAHITVIDENEPLSGDINRWCHDGGIIGIP
jgi:hypothetical protein